MAGELGSSHSTQLGSAVTLFIFNRPRETEQVFEQIRNAKPRLLFVIGDGPRKNRAGEADRVLLCREIVSRVDWGCEVFTNFSDDNLGTRHRIISGLDWVFSKVEHSIILEDDCLPHPDFFPFADELLRRFSTDERIGAISGTNPLPNPQAPSTSYFFSKVPSLWGWGTWARVWKTYDGAILDLPDQMRKNLLPASLSTTRAVKYWRQSLSGVYKNQIDAWDYQFVYLMWKTRQLTVVPSRNLVSNTGFGPDATHTFDKSSALANMPTYSMDFPIRHQDIIEPDLKFDNRIESEFTPALWRLWGVQIMNMLPVAIQKILLLIYRRL